MIECKICNKCCGSNIVLSHHIKNVHKYSYIEYLTKYENSIIPKCPICGNNVKYLNGHFNKTCGNKKCILNLTWTEENKERSRRTQFNVLKKKTGKSPWERRRNGEMSYLEKWFFDEIIIKHGLLKKYDIVNEYPEYPYFIDFAFLNINLAIEIDGKQHFRNIKNQCRDIKKQKYLTKMGWEVYRIRFNELNIEKVKEFICILNNIKYYKTKILEPTLYKFSEYKKKNNRTRSTYFKQLREKILEKEKENISLIKNIKTINFNKYGWVSKVAKLIKKQPQKINSWMKKYCPEILEKSFKKSKLKIKTAYKNIKFNKIEKYAFEKGLHFDSSNNVISSKNKILTPVFDKGNPPFVSIIYKNKDKHLRLNRFKAYILYGEKIYDKNNKVFFKNGNKLDWSDNNIILKTFSDPDRLQKTTSL
jgi:very-short-patch-repair endonuclease